MIPNLPAVPRFVWAVTHLRRAVGPTAASSAGRGGLLHIWSIRLYFYKSRTSKAVFFPFPLEIITNKHIRKGDVPARIFGMKAWW